MREKGILIRDMKNKKNIENSIRVSIGTRTNEFFWNIYKELDIND